MGLFFGRSKGHWIKHGHIFSSDMYECSECGREFKSPDARCPRCGSDMKGVVNAWEEQRRHEAIEEEFDEVEGIEDADY